MDTKIKHHLAVGREYYNGGDHEQARPHLEAVLSEHDGFADVHNMLGVIHYQAGRAEKARAAFERSLELNPRYTEAALNLAVVYNEMGRYKDAKAVYVRAADGTHAETGGLEKLDTFVRGKIANMHSDMGLAYEAVGLLHHATAEYRKALELCPTFVDIRTRLATTLRDMGKVAEALDELIAIRESAPEYIPARTHLGVTLWRADRIPEARQEWQYVLDKDPTNRTCGVYMSMTDAGG